MDSINNTCITPVGKEEFMTFEKLFNLEVSSKSSCLSYSYSADIWSLGVLVLQMTTYYPNEQFHKLPKNFAALMHEDRMPFAWFTSNMMVCFWFIYNLYKIVFSNFDHVYHNLVEKNLNHL